MSTGQRRSDTAALVIDASPRTVYQAFVDPVSLMEWLPPSGMRGRALEYDFREGGRYRIELTYESGIGSGKTSDRTDVSAGRFIELIAGRRIKQTVEFESKDPTLAGEMTMTWSFDAAPGGVNVSIVADNVPSGISKAQHDDGLRSSLENLASFVARRR